MTNTVKKSSFNDTKDKIIQEYKTTIDKLLNKITKLEKKLEKTINDKKL